MAHISYILVHINPFHAHDDRVSYFHVTGRYAILLAGPWICGMLSKCSIRCSLIPFSLDMKLQVLPRGGDNNVIISPFISTYSCRWPIGDSSAFKDRFHPKYKKLPRPVPAHPPSENTVGTCTKRNYHNSHYSAERTMGSIPFITDLNKTFRAMDGNEFLGRSIIPAPQKNQLITR